MKIVNKKKIFLTSLSFIIFLLSSITLHAQPSIELMRLKDAYPDLIQDVSSKDIAWKDGSHLTVRGAYPVLDFLKKILASKNTFPTSISIKDLKCDSYEPFFKKMYGSNEREVRQKLVTIYWMPKIFGKRYPLKVTTTNGVDKKIQRISAKLEALPASYFKFLVNPGGAFYWRNVNHEKYLSAHSFGIAIDINSHYGSYWLWDWERAGRPLGPLVYHNNVPMKIVEIFEQEGFLWGGRWYYYDTMHFEYRPEMFKKVAGLGLQYNHELGLRCSV